MISITIDFIDKGKWENFIRYIEENSFMVIAESEMEEIADNALSTMIGIIESERKQPAKGDYALEGALYKNRRWIASSTPTQNQAIMGIGEISILKEKAPYFEMLNDGGTYSTRTTHTLPLPYGEFRTFKAGSTHTIHGINYVGRAIRNLDKDLRQMVEKASGTWLDGMSKI